MVFTCELLRVALPASKAAVMDPSTEEGAKMAEVIALVKGSKGVQFMRSGVRVEGGDEFEGFVIWESLEAHKALYGSPDLANVQKTMASLIRPGTRPSLFHILFEQNPQPTLESPVIEIFVCYFAAAEYSTDSASADTTSASASASSTSASADKRDAYAASVQRFFDGCSTPMLGYAYGWVLEEQESEHVKEEGKAKGMAKLFAGVIGWPDMKTHQEFVKTKPFLDSYHHLGGYLGAEMVHIQKE